MRHLSSAAEDISPCDTVTDFNPEPMDPYSATLLRRGPQQIAQKSRENTNGMCIWKDMEGKHKLKPAETPGSAAMPLVLAEEGTRVAQRILAPHVLRKGQTNLIAHRKHTVCTEKSSHSLNPPVSKLTF